MWLLDLILATFVVVSFILIIVWGILLLYLADIL